MLDTRVLIAGCGDIGTALGLALCADGAEVYGLRRTINQLPAPIQPIAADLSREGGVPELPSCDYLVYCAAAGKSDAEHYKAIYHDGFIRVMEALPNPPRHIFYVSSTSVYGQHQHEWVDENSPTEPLSETGRMMRKSECLALAAQPEVSVVRFSGIYGPGREHLIRRIAQGVIAPAEPVHFSNRIHQDDCVGVLKHLLQRAQQGQPLEKIYLASDDQPTPIHEVMQFIADELAVEVDAFQPISRGGSKRCLNTRLQQSGYQLRYPDYRAGFTPMLETIKARKS